MQIVFNHLPLPVRERFVQITQSARLDPRVLVFNKSFPTLWLAIVGGIGSLIAIGLCLQFTIARGDTIDPIRDKEVYYGLAAAIAVLLVSISGILFRFIWKPPPFQEGTFVFTSYLVKASGGDLVMTSLADVGTPTIVTVRRNGAHMHTRLELGGPFTFIYPNDAAAKAAWERIAGARAVFRAMLAARDAQAIATVDPFFECTASNMWSIPNQPPLAPRATSVPTGVKIARWVGAALIGVVTAGLYYAAVDAVFSDDRAEHDKAEQKQRRRH